MPKSTGQQPAASSQPSLAFFCFFFLLLCRPPSLPDSPRCSRTCSLTTHCLSECWRWHELSPKSPSGARRSWRLPPHRLRPNSCRHCCARHFAATLKVRELAHVSGSHPQRNPGEECWERWECSGCWLTFALGWGPLSPNGRADVTPCFLDSMIDVVSLGLILTGAIQLYLYSRKKAFPVPKDWHYWTKLVRLFQAALFRGLFLFS